MTENQVETNQIAAFTERFINQTQRSIFLTGKAGTGKTTLLQKIVKSKDPHETILYYYFSGLDSLACQGYCETVALI